VLLSRFFLRFDASCPPEQAGEDQYRFFYRSLSVLSLLVRRVNLVLLELNEVGG
jgi:hypothetical protein